jgi:hypothetical protein
MFDFCHFSIRFNVVQLTFRSSYLSNLLIELEGEEVLFCDQRLSI